MCTEWTCLRTWSSLLWSAAPPSLLPRCALEQTLLALCLLLGMNALAFTCCAQVSFEIADITTYEVSRQPSFDVVYSRDTLLHIQDKSALFRR